MSKPMSKSLSGSLDAIIFFQIMQLGNNWILMGFLIINVVSKVSLLTAQKSFKCFSQQLEGMIEGSIILVSAPVSINPMTGTGLWNLEGRIDIFKEGLGMAETWLTVWTVEMTEISSESENSTIMKAVWSSYSVCSEKLIQHLDSRITGKNVEDAVWDEQLWQICEDSFEQNDRVSYRWNNGCVFSFCTGKHPFSWSIEEVF